MNGLEAIKAMENGEIVHDSSLGFVSDLYKMEDGKIVTKPYHNPKRE